jgi:hypothetical protein
VPDTPLTPEERKDALDFIALMEARGHLADAELPHVIICVDPLTGYRSVRGPYLDGYAALVGVEAFRDELSRTMDKADATTYIFDTAPFFTVSGDVPEVP